MTIYKIKSLILKVISGGRTSQVTEWDETVTSFDGYNLPNTQSV